jgi:hypothetical protein
VITAVLSAERVEVLTARYREMAAVPGDPGEDEDDRDEEDDDA